MGRPQSIREAAPQLGSLLRFMSPYMKENRLVIVGAMAAMLSGVVVRALEPWPLKVIFDDVIVPQGDQTLSLPLIGELSPVAVLTVAAVALTLITVLRAVTNYYGKVGFALAGSRVMTSLRANLFRHIHSLSLSFHSRARSGDLVVRVIGDIGMLREVAITAFMPMVSSLLVLLVMVSLMVWINWVLTSLILLTLPVYWLATVRLGRRIQTVSTKQRKREGAMAATAAESLGAIDSVQALSLEEVFSDAFSKQNRKSLKDGVKARKLSSRLQGVVVFMTGLSTAAVLWVGAQQVIDKTLTPGELLVFLSYLKAAFRPVQDFSKYAGRLAKASAAGERVIGIMTMQPEVKDLPGATEMPDVSGAIRFEEVSFSYEGEAPVLSNLNLEIAPGETVALVGASGVGKSSMLNLIPRLYDPTRGRVVIDDVDIRTWTIDSLRARISVVMQDTALFAATVRENIAFGRPELTDDEVVEAAKLANAHEFIMAMPEGYDSMVGERGVTLSAGQRQRIAVARAAVRRSPILLLDEPTVALDKKNEEEVIEALRRLSQDRTTLLVTHNIAHAATADRIAIVRDGSIVEIGPFNELLRRGGHLASMLSPTTSDRQQGLGLPLKEGVGNE